jgi:hypothetical protein
VESQEHEYQAVIDYFFDESPEGTVMRNIEKVASERIYGTRHDVWDVETDDGARWWVITNPMNVYPQEVAATPSMDHALALHIGVTARVMAREQMRAPVDGPVRDFTARTWRKFEQAAEALGQADEAEDFQAVGMRLRECLIAFAQETSAQVSVPEGTDAPRQADFKAGSNCSCRRRRRVRAPRPGARTCGRCLKRRGISSPGSLTPRTPLASRRRLRWTRLPT